MSKQKPKITIVGLGMIGGSIGMALRQAEVASAVVGHDKELSAANQARKREAIDKVEWNLVSACEEADLIVLATPVDAIEPTLKAIGPYLRAGSVLMDTAALKTPVLAAAAAYLPATVHFVGGNPILAAAPGGSTPQTPMAESAGLDAARADLFQNAMFCLVPAPNADPAAVKLVSDLVSFLGARPFFLDATEHDGLLAGVDHLPAILSFALLEMVVQQPSWQELRKVAGLPFELGTHLAFGEASGYSHLAVSNRDNLVRWIDAMSTELASLRAALVQGDPEALAKRFEKALMERDRWLHDRAAGRWGEATDGPELPKRGDMFDSLFGSFWRKGLKREEEARGKKRGVTK